MTCFFAASNEGRLRVDSISWISQRRMGLFWMWRNSTAIDEQYVSLRAWRISESFMGPAESVPPVENSVSRSSGPSPNSARVSWA